MKHSQVGASLWTLYTDGVLLKRSEAGMVHTIQLVLVCMDRTSCTQHQGVSSAAASSNLVRSIMRHEREQVWRHIDDYYLNLLLILSQQPS